MKSISSIKMSAHSQLNSNEKWHSSRLKHFNWRRISETNWDLLNELNWTLFFSLLLSFSHDLHTSHSYSTFWRTEQNLSTYVFCNDLLSHFEVVNNELFFCLQAFRCLHTRFLLNLSLVSHMRISKKPSQICYWYRKTSESFVDRTL